MAVRIIKRSWWVDLRAGHRRYRKRSPENTRTGALAYEALLRQKLARGESISDTSNQPEQVPTFKRFASIWLDEYAASNNKQQEQRAKKYIVYSSLIPFLGKLRIDEITAHHIEQYKVHELKLGMARKTVNNRLAVLRKCLATAYEWLRLAGTPPKVIWLKCPPPRTDFLSPDECELLLSHTTGTVREMALTALRTGMRQGELRGLQWASIDWPNRVIIVRHSLNDRTKKLETPKSNRERQIPMDIDVYEMLYKRKRQTGYVFLDTDEKPFDSQRLIRRLRDVRKQAKLRDFGWHTLRHTFASQVAVNAPLHAVQALLGHSTINMTMRYAHVAPSMLREAIDMLNPKTALEADFGQPVGNRWRAVLHEENAQQIRVLEKTKVQAKE